MNNELQKQVFNKEKKEGIFMIYCKNCGTQMDDNATECPICGEKNELKKEVKPNIPQPPKPKEKSTEHMSDTEMWSWLKKSSKRQVFYSTSQTAQLTEEEYFGKLTIKMDENGVPAKIEKKEVQWDRSNVTKSDYFIKPVTNAINPISCLVLFNHVGNFTFVEEKTFVTPPDLPTVPMRPLPFDENSRGGHSMMVFGIIGALIGLLFLGINPTIGLLLLVGGLGLLFYGYLLKQKIDEIVSHNKRCMEQEEAWRKAWSDWQDSIFVHSFQEDVNGQLSRIFDAVFECIKQVNGEIFNIKQIAEKEEESNANELEQLIERRKNDYK